MKINDLFETQQDEGIGSALGKVAGAVGKGVGNVVGGAQALGSAMKTGYKTGHKGAQDSILGKAVPDVNLAGGGATTGQQAAQAQQAPAPGSTQGNAPAQGQQAPASGQQAPASGQQAPASGQQAPAQSAPAAAPEVPASGRKNLGFGFNTDTGQAFSSAEERTAAGEAGEMAAREFPAPVQGQQGKVEPTMEPAQGQQAPAAEEPPKATAMKGDQIAGELKGVWDKASADQGSMTGSPQVQQQIIAMAKAAGLAGRKIESRQFYSKFLKQNI